MNQNSITLDNFEGPLDFLLHLIRKSEIDIYDVSIRRITEQYLQKLEQIITPCVNNGAEFIGTTASLLWMKSKMLLPVYEDLSSLDEELDPQFEIIHQLLDYCRFKEVAKELSDREHKQSACYLRGATEHKPTKSQTPGTDHLSLNDLASLFQKALAKNGQEKGKIHEEFWRVSDKINHVRNLVSNEHRVSVAKLFSPEKPRGELIVTFLAILELMKLGDISVVREPNESIVLVKR